MSLKKIFLLPALFILVHVCYLGCCKCITDLKGKPYRQITTIRVGEYANNSNRYSKDTVFIKDSLSVGINFNYEYIAHNYKNPFAALVNPSMALSCNCINVEDSGYKYKIDSIGIYSNNTFRGVTAGSNLQSFFTAAYSARSNGTYVYVTDLTIPQVLDSLAVTKKYDQFAFFTAVLNPAVKQHRFTFKFFTNGRVVEASSQKLLLWD